MGKPKFDIVFSLPPSPFAPAMAVASSSTLHSAIGLVPSPLPPALTLPSDINPAHDVDKLSSDQLSKYKEALRYFSDEGYRVGRRGLPAAALSSELNVEGTADADGLIESGKLSEDEMIFLVGRVGSRAVARL